MKKRIFVNMAVLSLVAGAMVFVLAQDGRKVGIGRSGEVRTGRRTSSVRGAPGTADQEVPGQEGRVLDRSEYLRRRDEQIGLMRGLDTIENLKLRNPRQLAIEEMQHQQRMGGQVDGLSVESSSDSGSQAGVWTEMGPAPIPNGSTNKISVPVSGEVTSIAVHPSNENIVFVGTAQGGLYRSLDGGATWKQMLDGAKSLAVGAVAISPSNPSTVWVGTGDAGFSCNSYFGVGLYRIDDADTDAPRLSGPFTRDSGNNDVFSLRSISRILVHPSDPNIVFAATATGVGGIGCRAPVGAPVRGVYRTTGGMGSDPRFNIVNIGGASDLSISDMAFDPGNPNALVVAARGTSFEGGGVYKSNNTLSATPTFTRTLVLGTGGSRVRSTLSINRKGNVVTVYAATGEAGTGTCGTFRQNGQLRVSTNGGETWSAPIAGANGFCGVDCETSMAVGVSPDNPSLVLLGGSSNSTCSGIMKRSTNGTGFTASDIGLHENAHAIAFSPSNPSVVYTGSDGGIWRSNDGGINWTSLNNSTFSATQFQSIALHPIDPSLMIGGTQTTGTVMLKPDNTWNLADNGDSGAVLIDQNARDNYLVTMYHTGYNVMGARAGFARVLSAGEAEVGNWQFFGCGGVPNGISCGDSAVMFYAPMALGPGNPNSLYFGTDRLYRSTDRGENMSVVSQQFSPGSAITAIGIAPQNDRVRIVALDNGRIYRTMNALSIMDEVTGAIPPSYVSRVVIDPNDINTAYVTLSGFGLPSGQHVWKTTNLKDFAPIWKPAGEGIPDVPVNSFVVDPDNSYYLYAGTDIGAYRSIDGGLSWKPFGSKLPVVAVFDLAIHKSTRVLRAGTHGRGAWEISIAGAEPPPGPEPPDTPIAPTDLKALVISASQVNLTWTDNSNNESGFTIERCAGENCANFTQIGQTGANVTGYSDAGLSMGTSFSYRVRAYNAIGFSSFSATVTVTTATPPPTQFLLSGYSQTPTQIYLSWNSPPKKATGFRLDRCVGINCGDFSVLAVLGAEASNYLDENLPPGGSFCYRLTALTDDGALMSNIASVTTSPTPANPANLIAEAISPSRIQLKWVDNSTDELGFRIERCLGEGCTNFVLAHIVPSDVRELVDFPLASNTVYNYRVTAYNANGNSLYSNVATAKTFFDNGIPAAPSNLRLLAATANRLDLAWDDNSDNETWFELWRKIRGERYATVVYPGANTASFSSTGLLGKTTYTYRVRACNANGCSQYTAEFAATTK